MRSTCHGILRFPSNGKSLVTSKLGDLNGLEAERQSYESNELPTRESTPAYHRLLEFVHVRRSPRRSKQPLAASPGYPRVCVNVVFPRPAGPARQRNAQKLLIQKIRHPISRRNHRRRHLRRRRPARIPPPRLRIPRLAARHGRDCR